MTYHSISGHKVIGLGWHSLLTILDDRSATSEPGSYVHSLNLCIQKTLNYLCQKINSVPMCYLPKLTLTKGNRLNGGNWNEKINAIVLEDDTVHEVGVIIMVVGFGAGTTTF